MSQAPFGYTPSGQARRHQLQAARPQRRSARPLCDHCEKEIPADKIVIDGYWRLHLGRCQQLGSASSTRPLCDGCTFRIRQETKPVLDGHLRFHPGCKAAQLRWPAPEVKVLSSGFAAAPAATDSTPGLADTTAGCSPKQPAPWANGSRPNSSYCPDRRPSWRRRSARTPPSPSRVEEVAQRIAEQLMPLLDRASRMLLPNLKALRERRGR
jgi:hypothetical protein